MNTEKLNSTEPTEFYDEGISVKDYTCTIKMGSNFSGSISKFPKWLLTAIYYLEIPTKADIVHSAIYLESNSGRDIHNGVMLVEFLEEGFRITIDRPFNELKWEGNYSQYMKHLKFPSTDKPTSGFVDILEWMHSKRAEYLQETDKVRFGRQTYEHIDSLIE